MASGQVVVQILDIMPPAATFAALTVRAGGSTPAERVLVWAFDASTIEYLDFKCYLLPNYAGGGITFTLPWSAASATSNATRWGIAIRRVQDDAEDIGDSVGMVDAFLGADYANEFDTPTKFRIFAMVVERRLQEGI